MIRKWIHYSKSLCQQCGRLWRYVHLENNPHCIYEVLSVTNKHTADKKPYMGSKRFHFTCKRRQISGNSIFYITLFSAGTWTTKKVARLNSSPALAVSPPFVRACDIAMLLNSSYAT